MSNNAKIMPNNFEAEQALLCAVLIDNNVANSALPELREDEFYNTSHKLICGAMLKLQKEVKPVDFVTVTDTMVKNGALDKVGGIAYLSELTNILPSAANYEYYLTIVKRDAVLRSLISMSNAIAEQCYKCDNSEQVLSFAQSEILKLSNKEGRKTLVHIDKGVDMVLKKFNDIIAGVETVGCKTGFNNLDNVIGSYLPGQMIVLAARPGCGKTSFAMNMVANMSLRNKEKVIAVFNLEMGLAELTQRFVLSMAEVPFSKISVDRDPSSFKKMWPIKKELASTNIYIDESAEATPEAIFGKLKQLKLEKGRLDFVVIDYLQLLQSSDSGNKDNFQVQVAKISRMIKLMAKELEVPILVLSQTSRDLEKRPDKNPKLSDLRDSGAIEQDADQVYFLVKDDKKEHDDFEKVDLHILKNRSGANGIRLSYKWDGSIVTFTPLTQIDMQNMKDSKKESEGDSKNKDHAKAVVAKDNKIVADKIEQSDIVTVHNPDGGAVVESVSNIGVVDEVDPTFSVQSQEVDWFKEKNDMTANIVFAEIKSDEE